MCALTLCNVSVIEEQWETHITGKKHRKLLSKRKLEKIADSTTCKYCKVSVPVSSFEDHKKTQTHKEMRRAQRKKLKTTDVDLCV